MSRVRDLANILTASSSMATDAEVTSAISDQFMAGKNKLINGDFAINQRSFSSVTNPNTAPYTFDRWIAYAGTVGSSNAVFSNQSFTIGAAPVSGYESTNFLRIVTTSQDATNSIVFPQQRIEDVRTFSGQTVTISFWAKAATGSPKVFIEMSQAFGSGGSPSSGVDTNCGQVTLSTSWARYSVTASIPSVIGKTIGTTAGTSYISFQPWVSAGTAFNSRTSSLGAQNNTFDFWGFQIEAGSTATNFSLATGSLATELLTCQRYYWRSTTDVTINSIPSLGFASGSASTTANVWVRFPVSMRGNGPTTIDTSNARLYGGTTQYNPNTVTLVNATRDQAQLLATVTAGGLTLNQAYAFGHDNGAGSYVAFNAEL